MMSREAKRFVSNGENRQLVYAAVNLDPYVHNGNKW